MKKTVIVNINGIIFHIDEDAYNRLNAYLDALHRYFDTQPEGREIVSDIESRIAELFQPRIKDGKQSITLEDVEEVIGILGKPEDIAGSGEESSTTEKRPPVYEKQYSKRLYRDPENAVLGGVCSGLAAYFSIDPLIMRLVFVALFFAGGASILIYLILWIVLPKAVTVAQRLEMRGEEININNIGRTYQHSAEPARAERVNLAERLFMALGRMFRFAGKVIAVLFGAFLILLSVTLIISFVSAAFIQNFMIQGTFVADSVSIREYIEPLIHPEDSSLLMTLLLIIIFIPLIGLMYAGLKLIIRFKAKDKMAILSLFAVWVVSLIIATVLAFSVAGKFTNDNSDKETIVLTSPKGSLFYLKATEFNGDDNFNHSDFSHSRMYGMDYRDGKKELFGMTRLRIEKSTSANPEMEIKRRARGRDFKDAIDAAKKIKFNYSQADSLLTFDPVFHLDNPEVWNFQTCEVTLRLPVGMKIYLDNSVRHSLYDVENLNHTWDEDMTGKTWQMTEDGLLLMETKKTMHQSAFPESITIKTNTFKGITERELKMMRDSSKKIILATDSGVFTYGVPELKFISTKDDSVKVRVDFQSVRNAITENFKNIDQNSRRSGMRHINNRMAINYYNNWYKEVRYNAEFKNKTLYLDPLWFRSGKYLDNKTGAEDMSREVRVMVNVFIPENTKIFFRPDLSPILRSSDQYLINKTYTLRENDFYEIDKKYFVE